MSLEFTNFIVTKIDTGYRLEVRNNGKLDVAVFSNTSLQIDLTDPITEFSTPESISIVTKNVEIGERKDKPSKKIAKLESDITELENKLAKSVKESNELDTTLAKLKTDSEAKIAELEAKVAELTKLLDEVTNPPEDNKGGKK